MKKILSNYQRFSPRLSELRAMGRDISRSEVLETPEYAEIMVYLELYGATKGEFWWIGANTIALHDHIALLLRKSKLNYRTQKHKRGRHTIFTMYFQPLPTLFGTYRPSNAVA